MSNEIHGFSPITVTYSDAGEGMVFINQTDEHAGGQDVHQIMVHHLFAEKLITLIRTAAQDAKEGEE